MDFDSKTKARLLLIQVKFCKGHTFYYYAFGDTHTHTTDYFKKQTGTELILFDIYSERHFPDSITVFLVLLLLWLAVGGIGW